HRDVKPANILLTDVSVAKVTDFGIGKLLTGDTDLTSTGQMVGSPAYMSPEQIRGDKLDVRSDIFSLGVVVYQTLTLKKPFPADTLTTLVYQILHDTPANPLAHNAELPPEISEIVQRCLAKNREDRYADASELAEELRALIGIAPLGSTSGLSESKMARARALAAAGAAAATSTSQAPAASTPRGAAALPVPPADLSGSRRMT
ncbi:MAG: serine/threonine protein kinase, partial [Thermoanaerobaculia bacterium]|nr:serine/threonine protein kinase [Thermoanaerobaculia bacterium]